MVVKTRCRPYNSVMHIDTIRAKLTAAGHQVDANTTVRVGVKWLRVDGVPMTELQARYVAIGRHTVAEIDAQNRKKTAAPADRVRRVTRSRTR